MWPFKRKKWEDLGVKLTSLQVYDILAGLLPEDVFLRDKDYRGIPSKDFQRIVFDCWFPNDEPAYKSEIFDCDDFAVCFMAAVKTRWANISRGKESLAFGYISADVMNKGQHAFIWHLDDFGLIHFYEPQTGELVDYKLNSTTLAES